MSLSVSRSAFVILVVVVLCVGFVGLGHAAGETNHSGPSVEVDSVGGTADGFSPSEEPNRTEADSEGNAASENPLEFDSHSYTTSRGDSSRFVVEFNDTDDAVVRIEDSDNEYRANLSVQPEDGQTVIEWNTYEAGTGAPEQAFSAEQGTVSVIDETEPTTTNQSRIPEDDYDLTAYTVATNSTELDPGFDEKLLDPEDVATIFLPEPNERAQDATASVAPADSIDPSDDPDAIREATTERDRVARGDIAVFQFDAEGVFGFLTDENGTFDAADDGVELEIIGPAGRYNDPTRWTPEDEGIGVVTAPDAEEVFLVVDTDAVENDQGQTLQPNTEYDAVFNVTETNDYTDEGENDTGLATTVVTSRSVEVTGVMANGFLQVPNSGDAELTVNTSVAPGSEMYIRARGSPPDPFLREDTVTVQEDGTATTTVDLRNQTIGRTFVVTARETAGDVDDLVDAATVGSERTVDRENIDGAQFWCCQSVSVTGFEAGETIEVRPATNGSTTAELTADETGIVHIDPGTLETGSYRLVDGSGTVFGPFAIDRQSIDHVKTGSEAVEWGEEVELTIGSDRNNFTVELFEATGAIQSRALAAAIPDAQYRPELDTVLLDIGAGEQTVTMNTSTFAPGTYEFGAVSIDATTGATTTVEITGDAPPRTNTYVAPAGSVDPGDSPESIAANVTARDTVALGDIVAIDLSREITEDAVIRLENRTSANTWTGDSEGINRHLGNGRTIVTVDTATINEDAKTPSIADSAGYDLVVEDGNTTFRGSFSVRTPTVALAAPSKEETLLYPNEVTTVSAWTNVAPGAEVFLRARSRSPNPFLVDAVATVNEDGIASAEFNFTTRETGVDFTVTARRIARGARDLRSAQFVDSVPGADRGTIDVVYPDERTTIAGFNQEKSVTLWTVEDGERATPLGRLRTNPDGFIELRPELLQAGQEYTIVDHRGTEVGPFRALDSRYRPYATENGTVETSGLQTAIEDWQTGDIDTAFLIELVEYWQRGTPIDQ